MSGAKMPYSPAPSSAGTPYQGNSSGSSPIKSAESTILVPLSTDQQKDIITSCATWYNALHMQFAVRYNMTEIDKIYAREKDATDDQIKSKLANRRGDASKIQNITVPIVMPQVNAALNYMTEVFLSGYPLFPIVSDPSNEDAALQLETIVNENATTAGWSQQLSMFFRDGLKYNIHAIECDWEQQTSFAVANDPTKANGAAGRKILWEGNVLRRMDLYNTFWDPRVHPSEIHSKGDFVGYTEIYSKTRFKAFCNSLYDKAPKAQVIAALASAPIQGAIGSSTTAPFGYFIPVINSDPLFNKTSGMDWMQWAENMSTANGGGIHQNVYSVTKVYARIVPSDYNINVPERNTPQVWKFIIVNGSVVLIAERMTNIHNFIPVFFGQPLEDGLDYQTKSFATNVADMQAIASAFWNGAIASKRRLVGDRVIYDPSRITESAINNSNPAAKIPVRPSAYGKTVAEAVYQFPFRDEQVDSLIQSSSAIIGMANLINGQNPAQQGQFVKGNKTRQEYDDVMGHGNANNKQMAKALEDQVMNPLKQVIKLNILQYQKEGVIYNTGKGQSVNIDPSDLRTTAVHFTVCDGMIPSDKVTGDDLLQTVFQQLASSPQLAGQYNLAPAFTYLLKTQGLDLTPFQKSPAQLQYEQAINAWQQAAEQAAKTGASFSTPQPQPSPAYQQEMQQKQNSPSGIAPSPTGSALESTQK